MNNKKLFLVPLASAFTLTLLTLLFINGINQSKQSIAQIEQTAAASSITEAEIKYFSQQSVSNKENIILKAKRRKEEIEKSLESNQDNPSKIAEIKSQLLLGNSIPDTQLSEYVESYKPLNGTVSLAFIDSEDGPAEHMYTFTSNENKSYRLFTSKQLPPLDTQLIKMSDTNAVVIGQSVILGETASIESKTASTTSFIQTGKLNMLVVLITLPGIPLKDATGASLTTTTIFNRFMTNPGSIKSYMELASYYPSNPNGNSLALASSDVVTIAYPKTPTTCDIMTWSNYADSKLSSTQLSKDRIMYIFPRTNLCYNKASLSTQNGWGELKNKRTWINGNISTRTLGHELTHNQGALHSLSVYCGDGVKFTSLTDSRCKWAKDQAVVAGEPLEYADPYDVMGGGGKYTNGSKTPAQTAAPDPNIIWKNKIGWSSSSRIKSISYTKSETKVNLLPLDIYTTTAFQGIKVQAPKISSADYYYLEMRRPAGLNNVWPISVFPNGVVPVRLYGDTTKQTPYGYSIAAPILLDTTAPPDTNFSNWALRTPGDLTTSRYVDQVNAIVFRLITISPSGATICVGIGDTINYCK